MASQSRKSRENDNQKHNNFENSKCISKSQPPLRKRSVQADHKGDTQDGNGPGNPSIRKGVAGCKQYISTKGERVAGGEAEKDHLHRKNTRRQERGFPEDSLEVVLLAARERNCKPELQIDAEPSQCEKTSCEMSVNGHHRARTRGTNRPPTSASLLLRTLLPQKCSRALRRLRDSSVKSPVGESGR